MRIDAVADPQPSVITQEDFDQDVGVEIERLIRLMKSLSEQQLEHRSFATRKRDSTRKRDRSDIGRGSRTDEEAGEGTGKRDRGKRDRSDIAKSGDFSAYPYCQ